MSELELLQNQLDDKLEDYHSLRLQLGRKMPDPYHNYDDLQLGNEALKPILIKPDLPGINYHDLVNAEIQVGLEGILSSIRDFVVKIINWIRDKIVAAYRWLINANDEIQREVEVIRKNTISEKHNELMRVIDDINVAGSKIDTEFSKLVHGHTIEDGVLLHKIKGVSKRMLESINIHFDIVKDVNELIEFKNELIVEFDDFVNNTLTGTIESEKYLPSMVEVFETYSKLDKNVKGSLVGRTITNKFDVEGIEVLNLSFVIKVSTGSLPNAKEIKYLKFSSSDNTTKPPFTPKPASNTAKITIAAVTELKDLDFKLTKSMQLSDNFKEDDINLDFKFPIALKNDVGQMVPFTDKEMSDLRNDLSAKHYTLISKHHKAYAKIIGNIDAVIKEHVKSTKDGIEAAKDILKVVESEYDKALVHANKLYKAAKLQKG